MQIYQAVAAFLAHDHGRLDAGLGEWAQADRGAMDALQSAQAESLSDVLAAIELALAFPNLLPARPLLQKSAAYLAALDCEE